MSEIIFTQNGHARQLELRIDGDTTWMTVAEEFIAFLQGCGFQVSGVDVADYLNELYGEVDYGVDPSFDFGLASEQFEQDAGATENVTLDDVMHVWARTPITEPINTITITTR